MFEGPHLVDSHVHVHPCFDVRSVLENALGNFRHGARELGLDGRAPGCLLLTEKAGDRFFERLWETGVVDGAEDWEFRRGGDGCSVIALQDSAARLILVAGRQVASKERLEILAIGCREAAPDGQLFPHCLDRVRAAGAVPIIPWGFGKWWFRRGRLLAGFLGSAEAAGVFLGDNGGRPRGIGRPRLFRLAEERGIAILPGSDPLPFPGESARVGSYGFLLAGPLDPERPGASVLTHLRALTRQPRSYGRREGFSRFCVQQARLRLPKRGARSWA